MGRSFPSRLRWLTPAAHKHATLLGEKLESHQVTRGVETSAVEGSEGD